MIANLVGNSFNGVFANYAEPQEIVIGTFGNATNNIHGRIYTLKNQANFFRGYIPQFMWGFSGDSFSVLRAPVIADLNNDGTNEVLFGAANKTFAVNNDGTERWHIELPLARNYITQDSYSMFILGVAVSDLDLNGSKEIIFSDYSAVGFNDTWFPSVYIYHEIAGSPVEYCKIRLPGSNQQRGAVDLSLADLNKDGKQEIIVPTKYELFVYDSNCQMVWNVTKGIIANGVAIADIDRDNSVDLVFNTIGYNCLLEYDLTNGTNGTNGSASFVNCRNATYVYNASGTLKFQSNETKYPWTTPALGNVDDDVALEAVYGTTDNFAEPIEASDPQSGYISLTVRLTKLIMRLCQIPILSILAL